MDFCEDDETERLLLEQMVQLEQQAMDAAVPTGEQPATAR